MKAMVMANRSKVVKPSVMPTTSTDWDSAIQLLHISVQRDVSPSRVSLSDTLPAPPPVSKTRTPQQQLFGTAPPPPPQRTNKSISPTSSSSSTSQYEKSAASIAGNSLNIGRSAEQSNKLESSTTTINPDIDVRALPLIFGQNQGQEVMSNWLGGMFGSSPTIPMGINQPMTSISQETEQTIKLVDGNKILVLLDMNGTLMLRLKGRLGSNPPAFSHAGLNYFLRDGVHQLVEDLLQHPRCELAFYTSMRESNAAPAVKFITGGRAVEIYDREYNKADNERDDAKDWDTMRDLDRVWHTQGKAGFGFDHTTTIMVDDSERKMRHAPLNLVKVPEFKEKHHMVDGSMAILSQYLLELLDNATGDVRTFIQTTKPDYKTS